MLRPTLIGDYSMDGNRCFHLDRRNLSNVTIDWNEGSAKQVRYDLNLAQRKGRNRDLESYFKERLNNILEWILHNKSCLSPAPDFVSARKTLRAIILNCYQSETVVLHATKFNGTIYFAAWKPEEEIRQELQRNETDRTIRWGHKFEQFMADGSDPSTGQDENESYSCVMRTQLAGHTLIYKCEVDGVDSKMYTSSQRPRSDQLLELKTQKMRSHYDLRLNQYKLRDTWTQCSLAGIPRVVVGFRDDAGVVHQLKTFRVSDFPGLANGFFSPDAMMRFIDEFLLWAKNNVTRDSPYAVYEIKVANRNYSCRLLSASEAAGKAVLNQRYIDKIQRA